MTKEPLQVARDRGNRKSGFPQILQTFLGDFIADSHACIPVPPIPLEWHQDSRRKSSYDRASAHQYSSNFNPSESFRSLRIGHIKDSASGWNGKGPQKSMKLFQKRHLKCRDRGQGPRHGGFFDDRLATSCDSGGESTYSNNQPLRHESPKPVDLHDSCLWCKFSPTPRNTSLHKKWLAKRNHHCRHCPTITKFDHPSSVSMILPNPFDLFDPLPQSIKTQDICHRTFMPSLPSSCAP